jgi:hypothetical protein
MSDVKSAAALDHPYPLDFTPNIPLAKFADYFPLSAHTCSMCDQPGSPSEAQNSTPAAGLLRRFLLSLTDLVWSGK